ncbi:MAG: nitroreductase family protein [Thermodesulfobacteriota bacterium]
MDDLLKLMKTRRSIRRYQEKYIPDELLEKLIEAARWSPSGDNGQPWRFIIVRDPETKKALGKIAAEGSGRRFTAEYFTGRMQERFEGLKDPGKKDKAFKKLTSGEVSSFLANAPVIIVVCAKLDVWDVPYDAAMATQNMLLMAHSLGLGSCVVVAPVSDMKDDIKVMKLLKIPHGYKIVAPLAIGYPDESPNPRPRLSLEEIIFYEEFNIRRKK